MVQPLIPERYTLDPFALPPSDEKAAQAFTPVMGVHTGPGVIGVAFYSEG